MPDGFKIDLFAVVPDARHMAVAPSTNMLFVGTRKTTVWAVTDRNSDGIADEVKSFAPSLNFKVPNGVCWTKDGFLVVAEHNRVLNFPAAEFFYEGPDVAVIEVVGQGKLIPPEEESYNHGARTCRVDGNGMLHVTLGQPYNVQPKEKVALYEQLGIGGMIKLDAFDGSKREVVARGVRNSVGMDINPKDKTVWFTDNQTDGMGDDTPPGELNKVSRLGEHFGYPFIHGNNVQIAGTAAAADLKGIEERWRAKLAKDEASIVDMVEAEDLEIATDLMTPYAHWITPEGIAVRPLYTRRDVEDLLFYGVLGVVIGGRLGYVVFYKPGYYAAHPLEVFAVWKGGMAFHGGLLGVLGAMWLFARSRGRHFLEVTDLIAPCVPTGLASGRNQRPFLLQTYRRDTGEILNDLSMPIRLQGRHWGCLRLGFKPELLLDGMNDAGLSAHLLYMPGGYCTYQPFKGDGSDLSEADLIAYLLGTCSTIFRSVSRG